MGHQKCSSALTFKSSCQDNVPWQLPLHIQVELLNQALPEVAIHGLNGAGVISRIDRRGQNGATGDRSAPSSGRVNQETSGQRTKRAVVSKTEVARAGIHPSIERRGR